MKRLQARRCEASLRSNVVFGQTSGCCLSLLAAYYYFVQLEDRALPVLILGNFLLLLGIGTPQALELPQRIMESIATVISGCLFKLVLALLYFTLVFPLGIVYQNTKGTAPFYYWKQSMTGKIEGWTDKVLSDEGKLVGKKSFVESNYLTQLLSHFWRHGDLVIMPSLLIALALGLLVIFIQTTPLAPMIYTLF